MSASPTALAPTNGSWKNWLIGLMSAAILSGTGALVNAVASHGQRITGIESAGRAIACTEQDGVWALHVEPRKEYPVAF